MLTFNDVNCQENFIKKIKKILTFKSQYIIRNRGVGTHFRKRRYLQ